MYNWTNNITLPKISDYINSSHIPPDIVQMFFEIWIWFLGVYFFVGIIGALAAALYIKYDNTTVPVVFFIVMILLWGAVFSGDIKIIIGIITAFVIGFLLYQLFIGKEE